MRSCGAFQERLMAYKNIVNNLESLDSDLEDLSDEGDALDTYKLLSDSDEEHEEENQSGNKTPEEELFSDSWQKKMNE